MLYDGKESTFDKIVVLLKKMSHTPNWTSSCEVHADSILTDIVFLFTIKGWTGRF